MDDSLDTTFKALADPTRRAMLTRLGEGEQTIAALAEPFAMSLWGAAKHVRVLEAAGPRLLPQSRTLAVLLAASRPAGAGRSLAASVGTLLDGTAGPPRHPHRTREEGSKEMNAGHTLRNYERLAPTRCASNARSTPRSTRCGAGSPIRRCGASGSRAGRMAAVKAIWISCSITTSCRPTTLPYPAKYAKYKGAVSHEARAEGRGTASARLDLERRQGRHGDVRALHARQSRRTWCSRTAASPGPAPLANFSGGWLSHLAVLEAKLAGGSVRDFWALIDANAAALAAQGSSTT